MTEDGLISPKYFREMQYERTDGEVFSIEIRRRSI